MLPMLKNGLKSWLADTATQLLYTLLVKLLFDLNLSLRLPQLLEHLFPDSKHVVDVNIAHLPDREIWDYATAHEFVIVTKDKDFYYLSTTLGSPPKVIWLAVGNCTNHFIVTLLAIKQNEINLFFKSGKDLLILQ